MLTETNFAQQALDIWRAGVAAVDSQRLVESTLRRQGNQLCIGTDQIDLKRIRRILVIGAGKAGAGMAAGIEAVLGQEMVDAKVTGWLNVPADCVRPLRKIILHPARPAGVNEPTAEGVIGSEQILQHASNLGPDDLCLVLISGGGSALLPAPLPGVSLADKLSVTRLLSRSGADIQELNAVRTRLSRIKGGGLLRAIPAGRVFTLIISDVIGDPLDVIASGPTVPTTGHLDPLHVLRRFCPRRSDLPDAVWTALEQPGSPNEVPPITPQNLVIGNNQTALDAARAKAVELGFTVRILGTNEAGVAKDVGERLAETCLHALRQTSGPLCLLSGGEPVVQLAATGRSGKGGRNQELILAAAIRLWDADLGRIAILSGGTDGEDGPTDAAGAWFDSAVRRRAAALNLNPVDFLANHDSYPFFAQTGGLLLTGPTHTNVMDVRVAVIGCR